MRRGSRTQPVLVTGAAGFMGSHLCRALHADGVRVIACDLPGADWWRHDELGIRVVRAGLDLADGRAVARLARRGPFDAVYHLASAVDVRRDEALVATMLDANVRATAHVLRQCVRRARRIVLAGTCEEYGSGSAPFDEAQREAAVSPYAWSKICMTHLGQLYATVFGAPVVVVRPFLTYGPLQTGDMLVPTAIRAALLGVPLRMTKGEQTRDLVFVGDMVEGLRAVAAAPDVEGMVINLGSGRQERVADVVGRIYLLCGARCRPLLGALAYRPGEAMRFYASVRRTRKMLGWTPRTRLDAGLRQTIEWYRRHLDIKEDGTR